MMVTGVARISERSTFSWRRRRREEAGRAVVESRWQGDELAGKYLFLESLEPCFCTEGWVQEIRADDRRIPYKSRLFPWVRPSLFFPMLGYDPRTDKGAS